MAKNKNSKPVGYLLDVLPKNVGKIIEEATLYKKFQKARMSAGQKEKEQKQKVLDLIKAAKLQPIEGENKIMFRHEGFKISVTFRDELLEITEVGSEE